MKASDFLKISSYQGPLHKGDFEKNLQKTKDALKIADASDTDFLLMPECFLHGYFETKKEALNNSFDVKNSEFEKFVNHLKGFSTTLIVGANVREGGKVYNSALIIKDGKLIGRYDKATTYPPYDYIECGREFPVFEHKGIKYGVIICYDSASPEPSRILALKGVKLIFCPLFNQMSREEDMASLLDTMSHQIARSAQNNCWFVTSDVVCSTKEEVCKGYTRIFDNDGRVVASSQPFEENLITYSIPLSNLKRGREKRLKGYPDLETQRREIYDARYKT